MKKADLAISIALFLLGIWVLWQATMLPQFSVFGPGPEFMPNVLAIVLLLLSAILFASTLRVPDAANDAGLMPDRRAVFRIAAIGVCLFLYIALLDRIGYLVLTFAYSLFMLAALGRYRWFVNVAIAAAITAVFYWSFVEVLGVPVPAGLLSL